VSNVLTVQTFDILPQTCHEELLGIFHRAYTLFLTEHLEPSGIRYVPSLSGRSNLRVVNDRYLPGSLHRPHRCARDTKQFRERDLGQAKLLAKLFGLSGRHNFRHTSVVTSSRRTGNAYVLPRVLRNQVCPFEDGNPQLNDPWLRATVVVMGTSSIIFSDLRHGFARGIRLRGPRHFYGVPRIRGPQNTKNRKIFLRDQRTHAVPRESARS
jgi:hypothetical protein